MWAKQFVKIVIGRANYNHVFTEEFINPGVKEMEYCIRGPLDARAEDIQTEIREGKTKPFPYVIKANIDNPHASMQKPITFFRQVLSCMIYPELMKDPAMPYDAVDTANEILDGFANRSLGSLTQANGSMAIRNIVARYLKKRDGVSAYPDDIVITTGASMGILKVLELFGQISTEKQSGIMIPKPCYPVYVAFSILNNLYIMNFYMNEEKNWDIDFDELNRAYEEHKDKCIPRALVIINPNNPTGHLLTEENIQKIIRFAYEKNLIIIADEVYQSNIFDEKVGFHSFKKCMMKMGEPYNMRELFSVWSMSKGFLAESGFRGGVIEVVNLNKKVRHYFYKLFSNMMCAPLTSQSIVALNFKPPKKDSPSYKQYNDEVTTIKKQFKSRAAYIETKLNSFNGIKCTKIQAGSFTFPSITIPKRAILEAKSRKIEADQMYCEDLLEETGICLLPGSGFGQKPDTYHLRIGLSLTHETLDELFHRLKPFHESWIRKYS